MLLSLSGKVRFFSFFIAALSFFIHVILLYPPFSRFILLVSGPVVWTFMYLVWGFGALIRPHSSYVWTQASFCGGS